MVRYGGGYSAGRVWVKCVFSPVRGYLFVLFGALYSQCIPELHWSRMVANLNLIRIKSLKRWGNPITHSRSPDWIVLFPDHSLQPGGTFWLAAYQILMAAFDERQTEESRGVLGRSCFLIPSILPVHLGKDFMFNLSAVRGHAAAVDSILWSVLAVFDRQISPVLSIVRFTLTISFLKH